MSQVLTVSKTRTPQPDVHQTVRSERPDPAWVRGRCPECGDELVSHLYYVHGKGYLIQWECWASQGESPRCGYKLVL